MSIHVKVGNVFKNVAEIGVKVGTQMRSTVEGYIKVGTTYRYFFRKIMSKVWYLGIDNPPQGNWISGAYGKLSSGVNRLVVIEGSSNRAIYSDASGPRRGTWKTAYLPTMAGWQRITFGLGKFVAVSTFSNRAAWSSDGVTWYSSTLPYTGGWGEVAFVGGKFIATQFGTRTGLDKTDKLAYSLDGVSWTGVTLPVAGNWTKVRHNGTIFVCCSAGSNDYIYSSDGIRWNRASMPSISNWAGLESMNGEFISIGGVANVNSNLYAIYKNGRWNERRFPVSAKWATIGKYDGEWVVAEFRGGPLTLVSSDGEQWETKSLGVAGAATIDLVDAGNGLFAVLADGNYGPRYMAPTTEI